MRNSAAAHAQGREPGGCTVFPIFCMTRSWNDCMACMLSAWLLPPMVIAFATTPAHCSVPCVATGKSTPSAMADTTRRASTGTAARHLQSKVGLGNRSALHRSQQHLQYPMGLAWRVSTLSAQAAPMRRAKTGTAAGGISAAHSRKVSSIPWPLQRYSLLHCALCRHWRGHGINCGVTL